MEARNTNTAAAWAFVLANGQHIAARTEWEARAYKLDREDVHQQALLEIVQGFAKYDPARGKAGNWIYWMVRYAAQKLLRQRDPERERRLDGAVALQVERMACPHGAEQVLAGVEVRRLLARATSDEHVAVLSKADGWGGAEVRAATGITMKGRNARLYRMRDRLGIVPAAPQPEE